MVVVHAVDVVELDRQWFAHPFTDATKVTSLFDQTLSEKPSAELCGVQNGILDKNFAQRSGRSYGFRLSDTPPLPGEVTGVDAEDLDIAAQGPVVAAFGSDAQREESLPDRTGRGNSLLELFRSVRARSPSGSTEMRGVEVHLVDALSEALVRVGVIVQIRCPDDVSQRQAL